MIMEPINGNANLKLLLHLNSFPNGDHVYYLLFSFNFLGRMSMAVISQLVVDPHFSKG